RFLRLLEEGIQGGESLIGKVEFEGSHRRGLQEKLLQKFTRVHGSWSSEWNTIFSTQISLELLTLSVGEDLRFFHNLTVSQRCVVFCTLADTVAEFIKVRF